MNHRELVQTILEDHSIEWVGEIVEDAESEARFLVTVEVKRDRKGRRSPANSALHAASNALLKHGLKIEYLLQKQGQDGVEQGLRTTLLHSHVDHIRNSFVSIDSKNAMVWIEPKGEITDQQLAELRERSKKYLSLFELNLQELSLTSEAAVPSTLFLMNIIRFLSPASEEKILSSAAERDLAIPSTDWLRRKLDKMRKDGRIVRLTSGLYVLTKASLHQLGTSKDRWSPDVKRLLELARSNR